jgi:hypothetical protein
VASNKYFRRAIRLELIRLALGRDSMPVIKRFMISRAIAIDPSTALVGDEYWNSGALIAVWQT